MSEAFFNLNIQDNGESKVLRCTGENTELFVHGAKFREIDHLFHRFDPENRQLGAFVFRQILGEEQFETIRQYVFNSGEFPIIYRPEPLEGDVDQFIAWEMRDVA